MLSHTTRQAGYSMTELVIGMAIIAAVLAAAAPNIGPWLNNSQIRTVAESIQNGLQLARAEAVRRNTIVSFYLTSAIDDSCGLSTNTSNWVISTTDPTSACGSSANVIQSYSMAEGGSRTSINALNNTVTFNGLGRVTNGANNICIGITGVSQACVAAEPEHQLAIQVSTAGQIRMCNMARPADDPQRC